MKQNNPLTTYSGNVNSQLEAPELDPQHLMIANELLSGKSIPQISEETGIDTDVVTAVVEQQAVKRYVDNVYMSQGYLNRARRLQIINRVIDEKMMEAAETGVYSKKDLLDWMKLLMDMEKNSAPRQPSTAVQINNTTTNYGALVEDLFNKGED